MAKKQPPRGTLGRPPLGDGERKKAVINFRVRPAYKTWVNRLVQHCQGSAAKGEILDVATMLEWGLAELAKAKGFEPPPER